jgi:lysophospholipase L1-like esterase
MIPEVVAAHPDIVVVSGGRNDGATDVKTAAAALFTGLRQQLPQARIFAISPMWDASPYPRTMEALGAVIRAQVERVGGRYVNIGHPLKDRPDLITKDGVHPNAAGYQALAASVNAALG